MKKFYLGLTALLLVAGLAACDKTPADTSTGGGTVDNSSNGGTTDNPLAGTYDITVWVSEIEGVTDLTARQIDAFEAANPGIVLNATIEGQSEADSATMMITDVESGADLYCFAQDQLSRLVQVNALNQLGVKASETVTTLNDAGAVKAATVNDNIYCYPLTSDNGYFMYYDKSVIQESSLDSLEALIADCEAANKLFSFECESSAWYNASWFFATGCKSEWTTDAEGKFVSVNDTFNSDAGLVALKGMQKLLKSPAYNSSSNGSDFSAATPSAVVITGTWALQNVKDALGDNFGATDLPSFEVDGKSYHLGSYSGNKLMGVKPQVDAKRAAVLQQLALYLTGEECQAQRFEEFGWGPSNLAVQATDAVQSDVALSALAKQNAYAIPQGQIHGAWWDIAKTYATAAKSATTDEELKAALVAYEKSISGLFSMTEDEKEAFGLVGSFEGGSWETDIVMEQKPAGTYYTTAAINFKENDEFKLRQGKSWDVSYGQDGGSANYKVTAEEAGYRFVKMVIDGDNVTVSLEKYNPSYSWAVIGSVGGTNWDTDLFMTQISATEYMSDPIVMEVGNEFKVRYGSSWDVNYGANGELNGGNIAVTEAGTYQVKLTLDGETATIELVPQA